MVNKVLEIGDGESKLKPIYTSSFELHWLTVLEYFFLCLPVTVAGTTEFQQFFPGSNKFRVVWTGIVVEVLIPLSFLRLHSVV
jgi:hypothetical protein